MDATAMVSHFFDALECDTAAAKHALEERPDVSAPLRTAERDDQHGVEDAGAPKTLVHLR